MIFKIIEDVMGGKFCYNAYNFGVTYVITLFIRLEQFLRGKLLFIEIFGAWDWGKQSEETLFYFFRLVVGWIIVNKLQKKVFSKKGKKVEEKEEDKENGDS